MIESTDKMKESIDLNGEKLIEEFKTAKKSEYSQRTLRNYGYNLLEFDKLLKEVGRPLQKLTTEDLASFIEKAIKRGLATRTIIVKLFSIKTFAKWLYYRDILTEKEYKSIEEYWPNLTKNEKDDRRALSKLEEKKILKILSNPTFRMLFWVGVNYGLRCSEFANLKVNHVDLKNKILTIHQAKGNKTREIPIHNHHLTEWTNYLKYRSSYNLDHDYVFFTSRGHATNRSIQRYFNQMSDTVYPIPTHLRKKVSLLTDLEKKEYQQFRDNYWFTPHVLRFTYATKLYLGEVDLLLISGMLGHSAITTTQNYLRIDKKTMNRMYLDQSKKTLA